MYEIDFIVYLMLIKNLQSFSLILIHVSCNNFSLSFSVTSDTNPKALEIKMITRH